MKLDLELWPHQASFIEDTTTKELALVGGRGCGKTYTLCIKLITLAALQAGHVGAALSPTGPMAAKVLIPEMLDALQRLRVKHEFNRSERRFDLFFGGRRSTIYVLSAENVRDGLGLNLAFFGLDEADTMSTDVAFESWRKLSGALRAGDPRYRQKVAVSTPEGFGFMYRHWVKDLTDENRVLRRLIRGRSMDNLELTDDYFEDLRCTYPAHYLAAYLEGEFVNMTSGSVYPEYDPGLNNTNLTLDTLPDTVRTLHLGMDFNVVGENSRGISIVTSAILNQQPYAIHELYGSSTTKEAIQQIRKAYPGYAIVCYPDASGDADKTSAVESDIAQLENAGMVCIHPNKNPRIKNRVNSVNAQILNGKNERRLKINAKTCPILSESVAQQPYNPKTSQPLKDGLLDGPTDALGYFVWSNWPVTTESVKTRALNV
jgi:hypothetical protein